MGQEGSIVLWEPERAEKRPDTSQAVTVLPSPSPLEIMSTLYNIAFHLWFVKLEVVCHLLQGGLWQVNKGNKPTP